MKGNISIIANLWRWNFSCLQVSDQGGGHRFEDVECAVADSGQVVILQLGRYPGGQQPLSIKSYHLTNCHKLPHMGEVM